MMIGNQYEWEETIASKVGDQASARRVSSKSGCSTGYPHKYMDMDRHME